MKSRNFFIIICVLSIISCKKNELLKEELTGEKEIFIGAWNWNFTHHYYNWCNPPSAEEILTPVTEGKSYSISIFEDGLAHFFLNDSLIGQHRMVFGYFNPGSDGCGIVSQFHFNIHLGNNEELNFGGCLNADTLVTVWFPTFIFASEDGCENHLNYFVRE